LDSVLSTRALTKRYRNTAANDGISIELPRGAIVGFVGENGSGKTTLIRLLTGLAHPTSGTFAFGEGIRRIGALVETPGYIRGMSAKGNILFHAKLAGVPKEEAMRLLDVVGLSDTGNKKVRNFSLGMRQRLAIAIALLNRPDILFLDEPTNGLDPQGIKEMRLFLESLVAEKKMTVLVSSHILSELSQFATHYLFISHGKIVETVSAEELHAKLHKVIRVSVSSDGAEAAFARLLQSGAVGAYLQNGDVWELRDPFDYASILPELANLNVTSLQTEDETLETYYLKKIGGEGK